MWYRSLKQQVLSVVAAGAVTAAEVQTEATIDRTAPESATVEETITVEVAVKGTALVESFDRDGVNATIVDRDGANAASIGEYDRVYRNRGNTPANPLPGIQAVSEQMGG